MPIKISKRYPKRATTKSVSLEPSKHLPSETVTHIIEDKENRLAGTCDLSLQSGSIFTVSNQCRRYPTELTIIAEQSLKDSYDLSAINTPVASSIEE